jgi:hypothetical protein
MRREFMAWVKGILITAGALFLLFAGWLYLVLTNLGPWS